jgi:hypothetical protein
VNRPGFDAAILCGKDSDYAQAVAAPKRILRKTLVQDFASLMRKRRAIEALTAATQVKASTSSEPNASIGFILQCW